MQKWLLATNRLQGPGAIVHANQELRRLQGEGGDGAHGHPDRDAVWVQRGHHGNPREPVAGKMAKHLRLHHDSISLPELRIAAIVNPAT